jgi:phosphatidylglycerophosphate synthase
MGAHCVLAVRPGLYGKPGGSAGTDVVTHVQESSVRNVPNTLSLARLLATIPLVVLILINTPAAYLAATALFVVGSVTDTLDGCVARRYYLVSNLGVFLDLAADKVFVARRRFPWA